MTYGAFTNQNLVTGSSVITNQGLKNLLLNENISSYSD